MFTPAGRDRILGELLAYARSDALMTAAALVGSGARRTSDRWSDIDLAMRLQHGVDPVVAAESFSAELAARYAIAGQLDIWSGPALYRVFLLADSLQIDLSFWPAADFASNGEPFELLFGSANPDRPRNPPDPQQVIGWAWLYAIHTRSAIVRGRRWQALQMIDSLRDQIITLACLRHGLPAHQGRGVDQLPPTDANRLLETLVARLDHGPLVTASAAAVGLLLIEAEHLDPALADRLRPPLTTLVETVHQP